jgi:hypothetical protein
MGNPGRIGSGRGALPALEASEAYARPAHQKQGTKPRRRA